MTSTIERAMSQSRAAARAGDLRGARRLLLEARERFPLNARLMQALAELEARASGLPSDQFGPPHVKRVLALAGAGARADAIEEMVARVFLNLNNPLARNLLGGLYAEAGHPEAALPHLQAAVRLAPDWREAGVNLGRALIQLDRAGEAVPVAARVVAGHPDFVPGLRLLAEAADRALRPAEAVAPLRRLRALMPQDDGVKVDLASALVAEREVAEAEALLVDVLSRNPADHRALNNLGNLCLNLGRLDEAQTRFRAAFAAAPRSGIAAFNLGRAMTFAADDPDLARIRALAADATLGPEERVPALFAAAKAEEDLGQVDAAFAALDAGNRLRRSRIRYDIAEDAALLDAIAARFGPALPAIDPALRPARRRPVFVVGMMRSGTTLAEQILSAHPQVYGAGELDDMNIALMAEMARAPAPVDAEALLRVRRAYLDAIDALPGDEPVVVDKMPANFRCVGLIAKALPEARILHMRRDPVAVCWSIWKTLFTSGAIGYAWDMAEVGRYYRLYEAFMARIEADFPGLVMAVDYQTLTETPEPVIRAMLDHCGLPFDPACLAPQDNARLVRTASVRQVRSGIYQGSTSKWRGFERHMAPLIEALGQGGAPAPGRG